MIFIKTEYSFREVFYPLVSAVKDAAELGHKEACIIDTTPFGFVKFEKACKEHGLKAMYGLDVIVTDKSVKSRSKHQTCDDSERVILIARNVDGIKDLYKAYETSIERYNRFNRLLPWDIQSDNLFIISKKFGGNLDYTNMCLNAAKYDKLENKSIYQCISGDRGEPSMPEYLLDDLSKYYSRAQIYNRDILPRVIEDIELPKADMLRYNGDLDFRTECKKGLFNRGLQGNKEYEDRLNYEIEMIESKNFQDYFMIVSDMIHNAKKTMIVGPGRGSSGGSLVCYVLGITEIDPIVHGLIFERFIDINRSDYPDIDTDYPDTRRGDVIEQTKRRYKSVFKLATISSYSPRTIINDFAKEYNIPAYETKELKDSIIERSSGDARAKACLEDSLQGEVGTKFVEKYPHMGDIWKAEGHARHAGTHAAGIIVLDEDIRNYGAIDPSAGIVCLEGKDAEDLGLLKIDCLGLRTLSVIENCLKLSGKELKSIYDVELSDPEILDVFNQGDLSDIFQFDGDAIGMVANRITVDKFNDLVAITSLGRPGALNSGGTEKYIQVNEGNRDPEYYGDLYEKITKETNGIVIYQEQTMVLLREFGNLSWEDVNIMRRIISKGRGDEFFNKYKQKFLLGSVDNGHTKHEAEIVWDAIASMGSYAFNKSHAVAYAIISYWCAYCKVKFPLNFLAANLNNAKDDDHALKMLRRYVKHHDIDYVPVDPDLSEIGWTIQDGKLIGGLTNIDGVGEKKAQDIIDRRKPGSRPLTKTMLKHLLNPVTKFDNLYPVETRCKKLYEGFNIIKIEDIVAGEQVTILGKLTKKDLRDRNDVQSVIKRGHKVDENTHYLNLIIEDDTGSIKGTIAPFDMDKLDGMNLSETLPIGDIVVLRGTVRKGWNTLSIKGVKHVKDI